ncbi:MAG: hypothetical protein FKY71_18155 [Spiribacter salinus]|uniref:Uncharacterized protein n=1 Tax=Spiribacter salinus TaxID=1335746 RepID=A0A540V9W4_9GAMM|nr:MAG: hypothetical protein FKY71_18155 [Spiribacter salinus]
MSTPYGQGFYETVVKGVATVDEVELTLVQSGTPTSEVETDTTTVQASAGEIVWIPGQVTFQSVSTTFDAIRVRVRIDGDATWREVGVWEVGSQSPGGNNVTVSNVQTTQSSLPGFGRLATQDSTNNSHDFRYNILDGSTVRQSETFTRSIVGQTDGLTIGEVEIVRDGSEVQVDGGRIDVLIGGNDDQLTGALPFVDPNDTSTPTGSESFPTGATLTISETFIEFIQDN